MGAPGNAHVIAVCASVPSSRGGLPEEHIMTDTFELVVVEDQAAQRELIAVAGFLAGYRTTTRTSYRTDLRIFANWCHGAGLTLFEGHCCVGGSMWW